MLAEREGIRTPDTFARVPHLRCLKPLSHLSDASQIRKEPRLLGDSRGSYAGFDGGKVRIRQRRSYRMLVNDFEIILITPSREAGPIISVGGASDLFDEANDAAPELGALNAHECFGQVQSLCCGEESRYVVGDGCFSF